MTIKFHIYTYTYCTFFQFPLHFVGTSIRFCLSKWDLNLNVSLIPCLLKYNYKIIKRWYFWILVWKKVMEIFCFPLHDNEVEVTLKYFHIIRMIGSETTFLYSQINFLFSRFNLYSLYMTHAKCETRYSLISVRVLYKLCSFIWYFINSVFKSKHLI